MGKNCITLDLAQCEVFERMTAERAGRLIKAIVRYGREGYEVEDTDIEDLFIMFKAQIDEEKKAYEEKCTKYKANIRKRWNTNVIQSYTMVYNGINQETESEKEKVTQKEKVKEKERYKENLSEKKGRTNHALFTKRCADNT